MAEHDKSVIKDLILEGSLRLSYKSDNITDNMNPWYYFKRILIDGNETKYYRCDGDGGECKIFYKKYADYSMNDQYRIMRNHLEEEHKINLVKQTHKNLLTNEDDVTIEKPSDKRAKTSTDTERTVKIQNTNGYFYSPSIPKSSNYEASRRIIFELNCLHFAEYGVRFENNKLIINWVKISGEDKFSYKQEHTLPSTVKKSHIRSEFSANKILSVTVCCDSSFPDDQDIEAEVTIKSVNNVITPGSGPQNFNATKNVIYVLNCSRFDEYNVKLNNDKLIIVWEKSTEDKTNKFCFSQEYKLRDGTNKTSVKAKMFKNKILVITV